METTASIIAEKSILVLTDFSNSAKNAADYAIYLSEKLAANLMLFNAYLIPDVGFDNWPTGNSSEQSNTSIHHLEEESDRLKRVLESRSSRFIPRIETCSSEGGIADNVNEIIKDKAKILMVIMGGGRCNGKEDMHFGIEITEVLVNVKCPTLIVPNLEFLTF